MRIKLTCNGAGEWSWNEDAIKSSGYGSNRRFSTRQEAINNAKIYVDYCRAVERKNTIVHEEVLDV